MMPSHFSPILIQNHQDWIYSTGDQQQHVNFKCMVNNTWVTSSLMLQGNGILHDASFCHVVGREFQLYPALQGQTSMAVHHHGNMVVQHVEPLTSEEVERLKPSTTTDVSQLDQIASKAKAHFHRDVNMMLEFQESCMREQSKHYSLLIFCYSVHCNIQLWKTKILHLDNEYDHSPQEILQSYPTRQSPPNYRESKHPFG
jgi:hypothetical protein